MAKQYKATYQGKSYTFTGEDGLTKEQAIAKIQSKLGGPPTLAQPVAEPQQAPTDFSQIKTSLTPGLSDQQKEPAPPLSDKQVPFSDMVTEVKDKLLKAREIAAIPAKKAHEGLSMLADLIPAPEPRPEKLVNTPANPSFEVGKSNATSVEPPQVEQTKIGVLPSIPKLGAEVVAELAPTFIHPDTLIAGGVLKGGGKGLSTPAGEAALGKLGKLTDEYIPNFKRAFTYKFGQPASAVEAYEQKVIKTGMEVEAADELGAKMSSYPAAEQQAMANYMKGDRTIKLPPEQQDLVDIARATFTDYGNRLVKLKALSKKTFKQNIEKYFPTFYRIKELTKKVIKGGRPAGASYDRLKHKQNLPAHIREEYGEILEAGYPTAKGLKQLARLTNKFEMFQKMSKDPATASKKAIEGWTHVSGKQYGMLDNMYIHPEVARDLAEFTTPATSLGGKLFDKWKGVLGAWKFGKVVLGPTTHARNMMTNSFWLDVSGVGHIKQAMLFPKAVRSLRTKDAIYQAAREEGLVGSELVGSDINFLETNFKSGASKVGQLVDNAMNFAKKAANKAASLYQAEEQTFKIMKFMDNMAKGMPQKQAALDAEQWIFNYSKVPPAIELARQTVIPFATYFSKAIPQLGKAIINNPMGVYKYVAFFDAMEEVARKRAGLTKEDVGLVREQTRGKRLVPLPVARKDNKLQVVDFNFLAPWGEALQSSEVGLPIPQPFRPSGPPFAVYNALLAGYDPFLQRKLYNDADPFEVKFRNTTDYLGKAMLPNLMPGVPGLESKFRGGYHFQDLMDAFRGEASFPKRESKSIPEALLGSLAGLKTEGVDISKLEELANQRKDARIQDIQKSLSSIGKRESLGEGVTPEEAQRFQEMMLKRLYEEAEKEPKAPFSLKPEIGPLLKEGKKIENKRLK